MFDPLAVHIQYVPGIGPKRAGVLEKDLGLRCVGDLLHYYPYKYIDRSRLYQIREIDGTMPYIQLRGTILSFEELGEGRKRRFVAHFTDGTGVVDLVWFQGLRFLQGRYHAHKEYIVFGKPTPYGGRISIAHPDIDEPGKLTLSQMGLVPAYNTSERMKRMGINSATLKRFVEAAFSSLKTPPPETLPPWFVEEHRLLPHAEALRQIHFPASPASLRQAQYRLKFEELFFIQLQILRYAKERGQKYRGFLFSRVGELFNGFYARHLPFPLTGAQMRVLREIRRDTCSGRQMNRLLQGDVGSGKTVVALMAMLLALDNGYQACLMAPTEILAQQHLATLSAMLQDMDIRVGLLTGSVKGKQREAVLQGLASGSVGILIGTHAVLEEPVSFARLGMAVIDEQHRFGVAQRARLWQKSGQPPHVLVMTATPIPRTLAMTLYGDLDVSVIDELPPGRKPVQTQHRYDDRRAALYQFLRREIQAGRQAYVVYPLIQESEKSDLKNLEQGYGQLCAVFPEYRISKVHGRMKPAEKDEEMARFARGETQILVATTVIEVGVNVPNASVMVIENAERFGLSQLHQLRGRVGRGAEQSYCILITGYKLSQDTRRRIEIMTQTNDGFEIAEADLKLRGPGDLEGTQQSGVAFDLKIANVARDGQLLQHVREVARKIVDDDPQAQNPRNALLWRRLAELRKEQVDWSAIS